MIPFSLAFISGMMLLCYAWAQLPSNFEVVSIVIVLLLGCLIMWRKKIIVSLLLGGACGWLWCYGNAAILLRDPLPNAWQQKNIIVSGQIISLPQHKTHYVSFLFALQQAHYHKQVWPSHAIVQLHWYGHTPPLKIGQHWQLVVRLKRPHGTADPGAFAYERWLFSQAIRARGYVRNSDKNHCLQQGQATFFMMKLRNAIRQQLVAALPHGKSLGLIEAISIGMRNDVSRHQWQVFQNTGTSHLIAISGLHIGFIATFCFLLTAFLWRLLPRACVWLPAQRVAAIAAMLAGLCYAALAGFAIPTQRALIMLILLMMARLCYRRVSTWQTFAIALLIIVLFDPFAILSMSFWLSVSAVATILLLLSLGQRRTNRYKAWLRSHIGIWLGLMPISLLFFQHIALVAIVANMVAIPVVGFIIIPLSLLGCVMLSINHWLAVILLQLANTSWQLLWHYLVWVAKLPHAQWYYTLSNPWLFVALILAMLLLLLPRGFPARYLSIFFLMPLFCYHKPYPAYGNLRFTLLDVGQGLATVVQTATHTLVFDTGAKYSAYFNMGNMVVVPFLHYYGIHVVDKLVLSHGDNDHIGGAVAVIKAMTVKHIITSVPQKFAWAKQRGITVKTCLAGQHWQWDGVDFRFLYPTNSILQQHLNNNQSCVLRISAGHTHILLTGDIEKAAERYLVQHDKQYLAATILVAPHHGSKTSSTWPFLTFVQPRYVLLPVGYLNRYHFPSRSVLQRYHALHAVILSTARVGAITFMLQQHGHNIQIQRYRLATQHFWNFSYKK